MKYKLQNNESFQIEDSAGRVVSVPVVSNDDTLLVSDMPELTPFTDSEWENILFPYYIYTENFYDGSSSSDEPYTPDSWAIESGYNDVSELLDDAPGNLPELGSQRFVKTYETFEYNDVTYELWSCQTADDGESDYEDTGLYGLLPSGTSFSELQENSMKADPSNLYQPFVGKVQNDEFYDPLPDGEWALLLVEKIWE